MHAENVETSAYARTLATDVTGADGTVVLTAGSDLGDVSIAALVEPPGSRSSRSAPC